MNHTALIRSWRERIKQSEIQDLVVWRVERINNRAAARVERTNRAGFGVERDKKQSGIK